MQLFDLVCSGSKRAISHYFVPFLTHFGAAEMCYYYEKYGEGHRFSVLWQYV